MKNGVIIVLIGVVVIFFGVFYTANDFSFFDGSEEVETLEGVEEAQKDGSIDGNEVGVSSTPVSQPVSGGAVVESNTDGANEQSHSGVTVVTYTNEGFVPQAIEVHAGEQVHFINRSNKALWVTAYSHPLAPTQNYPEFDQGKTISNGETYTFVFTKIGIWEYKNLNNKNDLGTVTVIAQD